MALEETQVSGEAIRGRRDFVRATKPAIQG